jgi:pimeloyl-ACP methyl ester carboxylesterase
MYRRMDAGEPNPLLIENVEDYERLLDFAFVKRPFIPRPIKLYLAKEAMEDERLNRRIYKQIEKAKFALPLEAAVAGLRVPTLIVWGDQDRILHVSGARIIESSMPEAKAVVMEGVGHLPMIEKPKETAELYLSFLDKAE